MLSVTPIYAALLTALFIALSVRVIRARQGAGVSLGHGGDPGLEARIRAQGNCAEYAPLGILLLLLAELQGAPAIALHPLGLLLLAGRVAHGLALTRGALGLRVAGMALTFTMLAITAAGLLLHALI
ncbi:Inner membrane protein YecN [Roseivivax jejudonensis]|uniref:Inner membrane protein YecN n=1 Tax=Roseivivax jejudonensis TaxID=1529041 RepID=A0A1X6ZF05_9RHOB|nr:MAPEG family protein [Roseivivax jejudonensis]SLN49749.1 Inner membrane protein YecN [Roseivivax jejudonensis]